MLIVDTSVWIDFLSRRASDDLRRFVQQALGGRWAFYTCVTAMELLSGCRSAAEARAVRDVLDLAGHVRVEWPHWSLAADVLRHMRRSWRRAPLSDVLTAAVAIEKAAPLVCRDQHFETIRKCGGHAFEIRSPV